MQQSATDEPSDKIRIIGVALVYNEELFLPWAVLNAMALCDEILIIDNQSTDHTGEIAANLAARFENISCVEIADANRSHALIQHYAGQNCWIFGFDGDEIFDPAGLSHLRSEILDGQYQRYWAVRGHYLHTIAFDFAAGRTQGYPSPPAAANTKLFNFSALVSWDEPQRERLHGHHKVFRPGWSNKDLAQLHLQLPWTESSLRCLHLCFFPRSTRDNDGPLTRKNPFQERGKTGSWPRRVRRLWDRIRARNYKMRRYGRGPLTTVDLQPLGRPTDFRSFSPLADEAEAILGAGAPVIGQQRRRQVSAKGGRHPNGS